ncbi:MAG: FMN-binding negative transcriptional regulator [Salinisphaera sp.]|nr:FMN-binding negative transcriptional regulator [Salinisphaera sp.]
MIELHSSLVGRRSKRDAVDSNRLPAGTFSHFRPRRTFEIKTDMTYPKPEFQLDAATAWAFLQHKGFGSLIVCDPAVGLAASHLPFLCGSADGRRYLDCHLAANNPMLESLSAGTVGMVVCHIDDAYIQPAWYGMGDEQVPTWLYIAVEAQVTATPLDALETERHVADLTAHFEHDADHPWTPARMSARRHRAMLNAIRGFRLTVDSLRGHRKLSQHKPAHAIRSMTAALGAHASGSGGPILAELRRLEANQHPVPACIDESEE